MGVNVCEVFTDVHHWKTTPPCSPSLANLGINEFVIHSSGLLRECFKKKKTHLEIVFSWTNMSFPFSTGPDERVRAKAEKNRISFAFVIKQTESQAGLSTLTWMADAHALSF